MTATFRGVAEAPNLTPPAGNPRFPLFDSLRAIAALTVFVGHTVTTTTTFRSNPSLFGWFTPLAVQGVAIFFVISGFLLYRPFLTARRRGSNLAVGAYARRRILRIVPAYWVALTIFIACAFVAGITVGNWWVFYGFGQVYDPQMIGHGLGVAWTLGVEMSFYVLLPMFSWVAMRFSRRCQDLRPDIVMLVVLSAASLAFRAHYSSFLQSQKVATLAGTFFWFALGMGLAILSVSRPLKLRGQYWPELSWLAAVLMFLTAHAMLANTGRLGTAAALVLSHVCQGVAALLILLPGAIDDSSGGPVRRALRRRRLAWIGLISYGVYLYHSVVLAQLSKLFGGVSEPARYVLVVVLGLLVTAACAAASYYLLERPIMRLGRLRRPRPLAPGRGSGHELL